MTKSLDRAAVIIQGILERAIYFNAMFSEQDLSFLHLTTTPNEPTPDTMKPLYCSPNLNSLEELSVWLRNKRKKVYA